MISKGVKKFAFLVLLTVFSGCIGTEDQPIEKDTPKVYTESGLATGQPEMNVYTKLRPGQSTKLERPYDGAPPLIPHSIVAYETTRSKNDCITCHLKGITLGEGHTATKIPLSHFTNEYTNETKGDELVGIRYNCLQCHVPQSQGEPTNKKFINFLSHNDKI